MNAATKTATESRFYTILNLIQNEAYRVHADSLEDTITISCRINGWDEEDCEEMKGAWV